ncbi:MAG: carbamate kinase, partial [Austwickia sp.]|nr:carbamate kinase [Austwickia sp.]
MPKEKLAVVAVGGNALITSSEHKSLPDQRLASREAMQHVVAMIEAGWTVVITHGNGPQVGFLLRRAELAHDELPEIPLDVCGADTQGATGYLFASELNTEFHHRGLAKQCVALVTQTVVDRDDPAFGAPSKPIGSFMSEAEAAARRDRDGWDVVEDAGRGWRRVVASPQPQRIVELEAIRFLTDQGFIVVAAGGGGIPVAETEDGQVVGVEAVIDKDLSSAVLARELDAEVLLIST